MVEQSSLSSWSCGPHDLQTEVMAEQSVEQSYLLSCSYGPHNLQT
jgi:hypothetical protein